MLNISKIHWQDILRQGRIQKTRDKLTLILLFLGIGFFILTVLSSFKQNTIRSANEEIRDRFIKDFRSFYEEAKSLNNAVEAFNNKECDNKNLQLGFYKTKLAYKKVEFLLEYLDPAIAKKLNGPPIPYVLVEQEKYQALNFSKPQFRTFPAEGLQVIEELIFSESEESIKEASVFAVTLEEQALLFFNKFNNQPLSQQQILEACREELIRIMTLGISGFDAPAAGSEIEFCATALEPILFAIKTYNNQLNTKTTGTGKIAEAFLKQTHSYLKEYPDFDTFNRIYFIKELADPAYGLVTELQKELLNTKSSAAKPVNDLAKSMFDKEFLQASYYAKQDRVHKEELIELGHTLFFDPILSVNNERSCASCHNPDKAFTDGLPKSIAFDFKGTVSRNSPTLLNAVYSNAYFWDSRAQYLQDQVPAVLLKEDELHGSYDDAINKLSKSKDYQKLFKKAYPGNQDKSININTINRSIAAYVQSLVSLNSEFDRYMRGDIAEIDESVKRGFNLFMGKAGCGTCHFAPVFNGTVPPRYVESESEVLGVPENSDLDNPHLDMDLGKADIIPAEVLKHAFKTPTVRNSKLTAPYMHNGVFNTLEEVMEFYNRGGGAALGLDVPNQTLPTEPLALSPEEKSDIIAFMEALTDTGSFSAPEKLPLFQKKSALNSRSIGGRY